MSHPPVQTPRGGCCSPGRLGGGLEGQAGPGQAVTAPALPSRLSEVKTAKEQAETRLGDCEERLLAAHRELDRLREGSGATPGGEALYKVRRRLHRGVSIPPHTHCAPSLPPSPAVPFAQELLETREELEEALSSRQRQEEQLRLRERELTALKGALKEEVASHDKELDRVRQQYQSDMDQLRRSMEDISQVRPWGGRGDGVLLAVAGGGVFVWSWRP